MLYKTKIIDGKAFANQLCADIAANVAELKTKRGITPSLAVILVGDDPASRIYVRSKAKLTAEVGMRSLTHCLSASISQDELLWLVHQLNDDPTVHGILVQLPLPKQINANHIITAINPTKDVDGFHPLNIGRLATGQPGLLPCTPLGCLILLKNNVRNLAGKSAVVVGRSSIVGKPMAQLLLHEHCTVTIAHSQTHDLPAECRRADILVAAVGQAEMIRGNWVKPGAVVIDVGINRIFMPDGKSRLTGDVAFSEVMGIAAAISPVPGGVGPMTVACLLKNTLVAASA
jgi:methylenetetrahydrofolate dehydrogenase (NADP+)/methenyltetrahydrofolate cyclohydrolase